MYFLTDDLLRKWWGKLRILWETIFLRPDCALKTQSGIENGLAFAAPHPAFGD
jgi:hypothetical protein